MKTLSISRISLKLPNLHLYFLQNSQPELLHAALVFAFVVVVFIIKW